MVRDLYRKGRRHSESEVNPSPQGLIEIWRIEAQNPNFDRERWLAYVAGECGPNGGKK